MGQGAPPRVITRTSGTVSVQLSRQPRVHPIASAIRSVRVSLTTDIAWSMASSIARLGQNWPVLALSPSSTSVCPSYLHISLSLSLANCFFSFLLRVRERVLSSLFLPSILPSKFLPFAKKGRGATMYMHGTGHVNVWACSCIWGVQRRKKQVTK